MIRLYVETTIGLLECKDVTLTGPEETTLCVRGEVPGQERSYTSQSATIVIDNFVRSSPLPGTFVQVGDKLFVTYDLKIERWRHERP